MLAIMLIMLAASIALGFSVRLRVPSLPLMIFVGVILGLTGWMGQVDDLRNILFLGLTFLLFVLGAELDLTAVGSQKKAALTFGIIQFFLVSGISLIVATLLGFGLKTGLYIGLAIASSSTLVVVTLLKRREQYFEPFGRLAIGVVLFQDILVVLLLPLLVSDSAGEAARGFGATLGMIVLAWVCARWLAPRLMIRLERDDQTQLLVMLATLFGFVGMAHWAGVPLVCGAFLGGIALSRFPVSGLVRGQMASLSDFFLAVFFVSLGVFLGMISHGFDFTRVVLTAVLLGGVLLFVSSVLVPVARKCGLTSRTAIEFNNLFAQCGELGIVIVVLGMQRGHVEEGVLGVVVLLAVITMATSPALSSDEYAWRVMNLLPGSRRRVVSSDRAGHLVFIGCGESMRDLIRRASRAGCSVVAVDDDPAVVEELSGEGIEAVRGDGGDPWFLRRVGVRNAGLIVSTMRRQRDHERLLRLAGGTPVLVRTFEPGVAEALRAKGATVVVESDAAADRFMQWFLQREADRQPAPA